MAVFGIIDGNKNPALDFLDISKKRANVVRKDIPVKQRVRIMEVINEK